MESRTRTIVFMLADLQEMKGRSGTPEIFNKVIEYLKREYKKEMKKREWHRVDNLVDSIDKSL